MKIIKISFLLVLFTTSFIVAQSTKVQLDAWYNSYKGLRFGTHIFQNQNPNAETIKQGGYIKCGLELANQLRLNFNSFFPNQKEELKKILSRPVLHTSIVSPSGKFRIHYDTSGTNKPIYSISDLAIAIDSSYNYEVTFLGYPAPPSDSGAGGDDLYDIYIYNLGLLYGETDFENELSPGSSKFTTYIAIDNDFNGFFTEGIDAARVTAAHELHHAIQVGNYIFRSDDIYFYELTSTAFEDIVYPSINDYFQYLPTYFNNTQVSFSATTGYELAIWNLYLNAAFDADIIKRQWQLMPTMKAVNAVNTSLSEKSSSFADALNEFGKWVYHTNYRNVPGQYFIDAAKFPIVSPVSTLSFNLNSDSVNFLSKPLSLNNVRFINTTNSDTIDVIVSNTDVQAGADSSGKNYPAQYILFTSAQSGATKLNDNYYSKLNVTNQNNWKKNEFINGQLVVNATPPTYQSGDYAFPNPFNYKNNSIIYLPVSSSTGGIATLNIYSANLKLLYSADKNILISNGKNFVIWDGKQINNEKLSSGVYIYVTKLGDEILKGKLAIFNE
ncbi:MAG: hypothetical protein CO128_05905 [Ignavibacteriales bacterium CG_4_9_14_3_um_filter_30_11]|nr:MAG: hypothetical protein CO128_05905 [Ignavibacteriales bacterium CG_4_9_14_3_um_filter_30_11]